MEQIIQRLKEHPKKNIKQVAKMLNITAFEVAKAQHEHLIRFRKCNSSLWDLKDYGKSLKE